MLRVQGVSKSYGIDLVLDDVCFDVADRERIALVGANGAGKSTLLRIILGEIEPDRGTVTVSSGETVAYLPQDAHCSTGQTLHDEMLSVFADISALEERQRALEADMRRLSGDDPRLMNLVEEHARLLDEFTRRDGFTVEAEIGKVLNGLGFNEQDRGRVVDQFSGGWQMRIALAKLLLQKPTLLLLDEPTNHLDVAAIEWLETYLQDYRGAVIVVSHDRYFMDRVAQRTLELAGGKVAEYTGNYSAYLAEKRRKREAKQAAYERQQEYLERQRAFIERFRASPTRTSQVQSREKLLAKMEWIEVPIGLERGIRFRFPPGPRSGREVLTIRGVTKRYGGQTVFANCSLRLERGDRVALVGENGAGKSTLLRLMAGLEKPDKGSVTLGLNVHRSYYAQHQADTLDENRTVLDELYSASPAGWTIGEVRTLLGRFLFTQDDVFKRIGVLSGGERARVALAKMLLRPSNLLLLDEPTNHLDLASREMLEEALLQYEGTVVLASHDRYFVDRVATRIVEVSAESVTEYDGNYSYYVRKKAAATQALPPAVTPRGRATNERKAESRAGQLPLANELARIEREIVALEEKLHALEEQLSEPDLYSEPGRAQALLAEYQQQSYTLGKLNARWEELGAKLESA